MAASDQTEDLREHLNLVFIGHVDAGKSTLSGQILYLAGEVDQRTIEKYEREAKEKNRQSWWLAFIMDTNEEERAKGKTVEVGRAPFATENKRFTILDAPGHKKYVPNMIAGAAQADVGVLVISARKGEFETGFDRGGQTREHAMLAKTLGVQRLVVAINKMDEETVAWSEERFEEIKAKMIPFLRQLKYPVKKVVDWIPISAYTGANVKDPVSADVCDWYKGPCLFKLLDGLTGFNRDPDGLLRLPILDKFKDRGSATALGKVESGTVRVGDTITIMPNEKQCEVTGISLDTGDVNAARAGENVQLRLKGADVGDMLPGMVVCNSDKVTPMAQYIEAQLAIMDLKGVFSAGFTAVLHVHTCVVEVEVLRLTVGYDKNGAKLNKRPRFVQQGQVVSALLSCDRPICVELFKDFPQLGRFTLRDEGKTIAIGKITAIRHKKEK